VSVLRRSEALVRFLRHREIGDLADIREVGSA
jgi:hypothetical protein